MLNFMPWDQLLRQYVNDQGLVDYQSWKAHAVQPLKEWLKEISALNLASYSDPNQRLALWINLYNALVIEQILDRYPIDSIRPTLLGLPNWIAFFQFFQRKVYRIDNQQYCLNDIEHKILRPQFQDPRIHFALVCAAIGCPLLRNQAYQPDQVQQQLEEDARRFVNNPQKIHYEPPALYCSKILQWYQKDFLNRAGSIPQYVKTFFLADIQFAQNLEIRYLPYDWSLNDWHLDQRTSS